MTYRHEWQLITHKPKLTPAEALVALSIARRIPQGADSVRIPIRTLTAESVGLYCRNTIAKAKETLEAKGVIRVIRGKNKHSRKSDLIEWAITCPEGCDIDHSQGNKKLSKPPKAKADTLTARALEPEQQGNICTPQEQYLHAPEDALRIYKKERDNNLELVRKFLNEIAEPSQQHLELSKKLDDPLEAREISLLVSEAIKGSDTSSHNYLRKIVTNSPLRLMPRALRAAKTPEELAFKELAEKKRQRELERSNAFLEEMAERERQAVAPPPELRKALGLA